MVVAFGVPVSSARSAVPNSELRSQVAELQSQVSDLKRTLKWMEWIAGIVVGGGFVIGFVPVIRAERRSGQLHELTVQGETAAQARTEQTHSRLLESSQKTLNLVNDTLELATQSSQRATQTMTLRAQQNVQRLDADAREILRPALIGSHFKDLVEKPERQRDLFEAASELAAIEGYLEFQDVELTGPCLFVRGMERYIRQEPRAATKYFKSAERVATKEQDRDLTALVMFWLGYQSNNLGKFPEAADSFRRAEDFVDHGTPRHIELQRIGHETRFFALAQSLRDDRSGGPERFVTYVQEAGRIAARLDELAASSAGQADFSEARQATLQTVANVHVWVARQYESAGALAEGNEGSDDDAHGRKQHEINALRSALAAFEDAKKVNEDRGRPTSLWSQFGLLEARHRLGTLTPGEEGYEVTAGEYQQVIAMAADQLSKREEPRSLASLNETRMIAEARVAEITDDAAQKLQRASNRESAFDATMTALNKVDHDVFLFSQQLKVNVKWEIFEDEVKYFNQSYRSNA